MGKLSFRSLLIPTILLSLSGLSSLFFFSSSSTPLSVKDKLIEESMSGVRATRFDKEGNLHQAITMMNWQHIKDETTTSMQSPSLTLYYPDGKVCEISADLGEGFHADLKGHFDKLHLMKNVVIQQINQKANAWWELKTSSLVYFPTSQTAMTDEKVTVISPFVTMESQGMKIYIEQQRVDFINQVSSEYAKSV